MKIRLFYKIKFAANARPQVLGAETKKQADAESKIKSLEEQLAL